MLVEFSVKNFRSIKEHQTLSLLKVKGDDSASNAFEVAAPVELSLLRSATIYGANAAGKSNLIRALATMRMIVLNSASKSQRGDSLPVTPFLLSQESSQQPIEFEIVFVAGGVRYQYGFSTTRQQIQEEWLYAYPKGRLQRWFGRTLDETTGHYDWYMGNALSGQKQTWQNLTRPNALFLSTAVQLNSEQLKPVYDWFRNTLRVRGLQGSWDNTRSIEMCEDEVSRRKIVTFLQNADIAVQDIVLEKQPFDVALLPAEVSGSLRMKLIEDLDGKELLKINFLHQSDDSDKLVKFDLNEESDGTQKLFAVAGIWLDSLSKGGVLVVDELHDNLHPTLVEYLVRLFHNRRTNPHNAQLIFTTHETSILSQDIFRRDQIWFCERDKQQSTTLFPLTDFSPRKGRENLEVSYLAGRYGALPFLRDSTAMLEQ